MKPNPLAQPSCPGCGSDDRSKRLLVRFGANLSETDSCANPWHDQPETTARPEPFALGSIDEPAPKRRTIDGTTSPAVVRMAGHRNNGRYNGNGRTWETPPEVFGPLMAEFGFDLDPCAAPATAKAARYFTEADDGLAQDWGRSRVFMNPPYGREIYAWTRKAREASERGALVVGLLPASTDLRWFHEDVLGAGAEVRFIRGRVRFLNGGPYRASGFFPSVVVVWRPKASSPESR